MADKCHQSSNSANAEEFSPEGAAAFFVVMILSFGLIWLGMYALLLHRQSGF